MVKSIVGTTVVVLGLLVAEEWITESLDLLDEDSAGFAATLPSASLPVVFEVVCSERDLNDWKCFELTQTRFQKYS